MLSKDRAGPAVEVEGITHCNGQLLRGICLLRARLHGNAGQDILVHVKVDRPTAVCRSEEHVSERLVPGFVSLPCTRNSHTCSH